MKKLGEDYAPGIGDGGIPHLRNAEALREAYLDGLISQSKLLLDPTLTDEEHYQAEEVLKNPYRTEMNNYYKSLKVK